MMLPLDRSIREPLWSQLHTDLLHRLSTGEFDHDFPAEAQLRDEYGVSRHTVREAMRRIRGAGLVRSGPGRTSEVLATTIEQPLGSLYSFFREAEDRGMTQTSIVLACAMTTNSRAAARLELPVDSELFTLERLRLTDGEPMAHDCVWLPGDIGRLLLGTDFTRTALYDELERHDVPRPAAGRERITATLLAPEMAEQLEVPYPAAGLTIERTGFSPRGPLECRLTTIRADRYALLMSWDGHGYTVNGQAPPAGSPEYPHP